jgi:hypothetical protein
MGLPSHETTSAASKEAALHGDSILFSYLSYFIIIIVLRSGWAICSLFYYQSVTQYLVLFHFTVLHTIIR